MALSPQHSVFCHRETLSPEDKVGDTWGDDAEVSLCTHRHTHSSPYTEIEGPGVWGVQESQTLQCPALWVELGRSARERLREPMCLLCEPEGLGPEPHKVA